MNKIKLNKKRRLRRKRLIRKKINGTLNKPRLSVYKSNKYIYVQAIDDEKGITIASESSLTTDKKKRKLNKEVAGKVGEAIGKKLMEKKINSIIFDRNGFLYTGKIKALAEGTRKSGIKF